MSSMERRHYELHEAARQSWGDEAAATLMEAFPPMDWSQVATKKDLELLEARLHRHLAEELRHVSDEMRHQTTRLVTVMSVVAGASLAAAEALSRVG